MREKTIAKKKLRRKERKGAPLIRWKDVRV
jgi:hypothetical protein